MENVSARVYWTSNTLFSISWVFEGIRQNGYLDIIKSFVKKNWLCGFITYIFDFSIFQEKVDFGGHCIMIRGEFRTLSNINDRAERRHQFWLKKLNHFWQASNTPQMMTVARYWESISNKTKILLGVLAKRRITMYSWEWQYLQNK